MPTERSVPSFVARILSRFVRCLVAIVPASQCFGQQVRPAAAQGAFEAFTIQSGILGEERRFAVYNQERLASNRLTAYPVLYLLDENDRRTSKVHVRPLLQGKTV